MPASIPPPYVLAQCPRTSAEDERIGALMDRTLDGDVGAWRDLCLAVAPISWAVTASRCSTARLRASTDDRLQIGVRVLGALHDDDYRALRTLRKPGGNPEIRAWLVTVATRATIHHLRENADRLRSRAAKNDEGTGTYMEVSPAPPEPGTDPMWIADARHVVQELFPELTPEQGRALALWVEDNRYVEIAALMGLPGALAAERLVTAAIKRLARRVAEPDDAPPSEGPRGRRAKK